MRTIKLLVTILATIAIVYGAHFSYSITPGVSMIIGVPSAPKINGVDCAIGDEIAVFSSSDMCVGSYVWDGDGVAISIYGDDIYTSDSVEGLAANEPFSFRLWDASEDKEYDADVIFLTGTNRFISGSFAELTSLTVETGPEVTANPSDITVNRGSSASFSVTADGAPTLTYQWQKNSSNISGATSATYTIANVVLGDTGTYRCVVSNGKGSATSAAATLAVNNQKPTFTSATAQTIAEDNTLTITLDMLEGENDGDGDPLTVEVGTGSNYTVSGTTITPAANWSGTLTVPVSVYDGIESSSIENMSVTVTAENDAPTLSAIQDQQATKFIPWSYTVSANDVEGTTLSYSVNGPAEMEISTSGVISWTPGSSDIGTKLITVTVSDGSLTANRTFNLEVYNSNSAPILNSVIHQTIDEDTELDVTLLMVDATDIDGDELTIELGTTQNAQILGTKVTPNQDFSGAITVPVRVSDGTEQSDWINLILNVTPVNDAPTITTRLDTTINKGSEFRITLDMFDGADVDGDELTILFFDDHQSINSYVVDENGLVTPDADFTGTLSIPFVLFDGTDSSEITNVYLTVSPGTAIDQYHEVRDYYNNKLLFAPNPTNLSKGEVFFTTPAFLNGYWEVTIFDNLGNRIDHGSFYSNGGCTYRWDLRNEAGIEVTPGAYIAILKYKQEDGSIEIIKRMIGIQR